MSNFDFTDSAIAPAYTRVRDSQGSWLTLDYAGSKTKVVLESTGDGGVAGLCSHLSSITPPKLLFGAIHHETKGVVALALVPPTTSAVFKATACGLHFNTLLADLFKEHSAKVTISKPEELEESLERASSTLRVNTELTGLVSNRQKGFGASPLVASTPPSNAKQPIRHRDSIESRTNGTEVKSQSTNGAASQASDPHHHDSKEKVRSNSALNTPEASQPGRQLSSSQNSLAEPTPLKSSTQSTKSAPNPLSTPASQSEPANLKSESVASKPEPVVPSKSETKSVSSPAKSDSVSTPVVVLKQESPIVSTPTITPSKDSLPALSSATIDGYLSIQTSGNRFINFKYVAFDGKILAISEEKEKTPLHAIELSKYTLSPSDASELFMYAIELISRQNKEDRWLLSFRDATERDEWLAHLLASAS